MKLKKKIIAPIIIVLILLTSMWFIGDYFYNVAINKDSEKKNVTEQDSDGLKDKFKAANYKWFDKNKIMINSKSVTKLNIVGYKFLPKVNNKKWVFVVHGYNTEAKRMSGIIRGYYNRGYNVFAPDLLAHGNSEGHQISMGGFDSDDLINWIKLISSEYNNPKIILHGLSMGGFTVLNTVTKDIPNNVIAFIDDSGYIDLNTQFKYQLNKLYHLPAFPILNLAGFVTQIKAGFNFKDLNVRNKLHNVTIPALILHGDNDGFVLLENSQEVYNNINSKNKRLYIFKGAKHAQAEILHRDTFWNVIDEFLKSLDK